MIWLLVGGLVALAAYELIAAITHRWLTISQRIWRLQQAYPWLKYLVLASLLVLAWHFYSGG